MAASCAATWSPTSSTGQASRHEAGHNTCLYRYHSSILYIRRNILTYLSMLLVLSMNITSNATVTSPQ